MGNPVKVRALVSRVVNHGEGVYTLVLSAERSFPRFRPGQFLHLTVEPYEPAGGFWPESRVFSIASGPGAETITIAYSVKGRYTRRIQEALQEGSTVWVKLPYGHFIIDSLLTRDQDAVLVAGGTGITPFVPYLEQRLAAGCNGGRLMLYYGARTPGLILFQELLARCVVSLPGFSLDISIEAGEAPSFATGGKVHVHSGRLEIGRIRQDAEGLRNPAFFLSGPLEMIRLFREELAGSGVSRERLYIDEWE